mmetsp:Transcript_68091/g.197320  ORF Transcript_68091/g.197320 Transcript_68091/m.197320 type:complete len:615 (-) Transcript_68091:217-2061(-)
MECSLLMNADFNTEHILQQIMEEAKTLVGAEVASVFLVTGCHDSLVSTLNSTGGELRIPITAGIAGHVATTGEPVVIPDAYSDPRFDKSVDKKTGFRTRSILCVPLKVKRGIIGVVNLINKICSGVVAPDRRFPTASEADAFTVEDLQFLQVFASQAATTIASSMTLDDPQPQVGRSCSSGSERSPARSPCDQLLSVRRHCFGKEDAEHPALDSVPVAAKSDAANSLPNGVVAIGCADACGCAASRTESCEAILADAYRTWRLDDFALRRASGGRSLSMLGCYLFERSGLIEHFSLDPHKVQCFFKEIEQGHTETNPYHNSVHVASVMHKVHAILEHTDLAKSVASVYQWEDVREGSGERLVQMACLLAAAVHDYQHRGLSNDFLVRTSDEWAIRYNDRQVNENHHVAAAFSVLMLPECSFLDKLGSSDFQRLRKLMLAMVLGTDMSDHSSIVAKFSKALTKAGLPPSSSPAAVSDSAACYMPACEQDALLLAQIVIKCSDLGHLTLGWESHLSWVSLLEDEFFAQGDKEKELGLSPVSFLMDRDKPGASQTQVGFLDCVARPLFGVLGVALPRSKPFVTNMEDNYQRWKEAEANPESISRQLEAARARVRRLT